MRVTSASNRPATGARRTGRGGSATFTLGARAEAASAAPAGGLGMLTSIDALATLQGLDGVEANTSPAGDLVARGDGLLDDLGRLRDGLLAGGLDRQALNGLQRQLGEHRSRGSDPRLDAILDDIELRVAVELAKHELAEQPTPDMAEPAPEDPPLSTVERSVHARRAYGAAR